MADKTVVSRVKRQRELRVAEGWQEVTVWVPTRQDADDIKTLASERRAKAEALHGLSQEVKSVSPSTEARIAAAIEERGSAAYIHYNGPVLELLSDLAEEDDLEGFSRAFVILARSSPMHAPSVASFVPAKIGTFLAKHRGVDVASFQRWTEANPGWADALEAAVRHPTQFAGLVETMAIEIKGMRRAQ